MTRANFYVIGAARSGTTSLHHYLGQHPEIYMCPVKEPNFYAFDGSTAHLRGPSAQWLSDHSVVSRSAYAALFENAGNARAIGEVSPLYLSTAGSAERIQHENPGAKMVAILRHPVDRAFASFVAHRREGWEPCANFREAFDDDGRRVEEGWVLQSLFSAGCYAEKLTPYYQRFLSTQIRVYLYEDLVQAPAALMADLFAFLDVDSDFVPDLASRYNESGEIRNPLVALLWKHSYRLRRELRRFLPKSLRDLAYARITRDLHRPYLDDRLRAELTERYRDEIVRLQNMIDRDLSHWLRERCSAVP